MKRWAGNVMRRSRMGWYVDQLAVNPIMLARFLGPQDLKSWKKYSDEDLGGYSTMSVDISPENRSLIFSGELSLKTKGMDVDKSGYCSIMNDTIDVALPDEYSHIDIRCKTDGRAYTFNLKSDQHMYQHLFTTPPGTWHNVVLSLREFQKMTFNSHEKLDSFELTVPAIQAVGVLMSERLEGPFNIEIEYIRALSLESLKQMQKRFHN